MVGLTKAAFRSSHKLCCLMESRPMASEETATPEPPARDRRGNPLFYVVAAILLAVSAFGVFLLLSEFGRGTVNAQGQLLLMVGMVGFPLLMLGALVGGGVRAFEQTKLAAGFQARLDQLQNRLSYREDLLRLVSDHQAGAIAIFDRHNRYWFVNQRAADNIGKMPAEIIGKPPIKVLGNDRAKRLEVRLAEARAAERYVEFVDQVVSPDGETRFMQSHYEAIEPFADMTGGVLVSEDDLTGLIVERERRERMLRQVIDTLVAVVDRRDPYAAGHSGRVGQLARLIAEEMGLDAILVEAAEIAGSLMNFGKVLVSRRILTKTTALTPDELQRVRDSILTSADILAIIGFEGPVVPTLRQVMERYDGAGVPEGLKGDEILVTARIVAVANAFVALVSPRAHRDSLSVSEAVARIMTEADTAFDRKVLIALSHHIENRPNKLDWLTATKQA